MAEKKKYPEKEIPMDADNLLLAFTIQFQGNYSEEKLQKRRSWIEKSGNILTDAEYADAAAGAKKKYFEQPAEFFVCRSGPCRDRSSFAEREEIRRIFDERVRNCTFSFTECHGPCKHAPVATLRIGERAERFAEMSGIGDWGDVIDYVARAAEKSTLLVDPHRAEPFRFDPAHDGGQFSPALREFQYLVGRFKGEGVYLEKSGGFHKELASSWEAGGRFISMRMSAAYPLDESGVDVHHAFVVLGMNAESECFEGRAYTDGGLIHEYSMERDGGNLIFTDRVPGHAPCSQGPVATRARKIIRPTAEGFEEILEIAEASGPWRPYYHVRMKRSEQ